MDLTIQVQQQSLRYDFQLAGEIDAYTAPQLKEALAEVDVTEQTEIVVHVNDVSYMDSTGLGVFVGFYKKVKAANGQLRIVALNDRLYRLFEITGLNEVIDIERLEREDN